MVIEQYKMETILTALAGGIGVLWHQLLKQIGINRTDQKEFSETLARNIEVIAECNRLLREIKEGKR